MRVYAEPAKIKLSSWAPNDDGTWPIPATMSVAPIRCTMPVPCGHCWYCKQAQER